jgi:uncharacterized protein
MSESALIIFAKNPILGNVKTRIGFDLGEEKALEIYQELLEITFQIIQPLNIPKYLYWDTYPKNLKLGEGMIPKLQKGIDLGQRMENAFKEVLNIHKQACIIGTDCPYLKKEHIESAFSSLDSHFDFCVGPALDGGYYLLGIKSHSAIWFQNIKWSQADVFTRTWNIGVKHNLKGYSLPKLGDIDTMEDYKTWKSLTILQIDDSPYERQSESLNCLDR